MLFVVAPFARSGGLPYPTGANSTEAQARAYAASIASDPDSLWFKSGKAPDRQQHLTDAFVVGPGGVNIAAFSDDGVNVYVTDLTDFLNQTGAYQSKLALPGLGKGQALPNIGESFHKLDYNFVAGHIYRIMVFYNNIVYTGDGDIDGASLIAYGGTVSHPVGDPPRLSLAVDDDEVTIGKKVRLTGSISGGTGAYDEDRLAGVTWSWSCPDTPEDLNELEEQYRGGENAVLDACETAVGTKVYHCVAETVLGAKVKATATVTILGPDGVRPVVRPLDLSAYPPVTKQMVEFRFYRDGEEIGADCCIPVLDAEERIFQDTSPSTPGWQGFWQVAKADPASGILYWDCNFFADVKSRRVGMTQAEWDTFPVGTAMKRSVKQEVRIKLPTVCGGGKWFSSDRGWRVDRSKTGPSLTDMQVEFTLLPAPPVEY